MDNTPIDVLQINFARSQSLERLGWIIFFLFLYRLIKINKQSIRFEPPFKSQIGDLFIF